MARNSEPSNIPNNWKHDYLDSFSVRGSGHTPNKKNTNYWNGGIKWVSLADSSKLDKGLIFDTDKEISNAGLENSSAVLHPAGTVILTRDAGVGKSAVLAEPMAVSQHFMAWRCDNKKLNNWFLYYWLQKMKPEFERQAVGSTIKTIGLPYFKKLKITAPSYPEQLKISEIFMTWDNAISTAEQLLKNARFHKDSISHLLLSGRKRFPNFGDWRLEEIGNLITESRIQGSTGNIAKKLTVRLYGQGVFAKNERRAGSESTKYYKRSAGQFIYSKLDFLNGAFGIIPEYLDGFESTLDLPAFDFKSSVNPVWFFKLVSQERFYTSKLDLAHGGRKARRVNPTDLIKVKINMPPYEEQQKISLALSVLDREIEVLQKKLTCLRKEKKALMQQLLTGKIRVKVEAA